MIKVYGSSKINGKNWKQILNRFKIFDFILEGHETYEARLESFKNWPKTANQNPSDLAHAGFYYLGHKDQVRCFNCAVGIQKWEQDDDPFLEHAIHSPTCPYLMVNKGKIKRVPETEEPFTTLINKEIQAPVDHTLRIMQLEAYSSQLLDMLQSNACKICRQKEATFIMFLVGIYHTVVTVWLLKIIV